MINSLETAQPSTAFNPFKPGRARKLINEDIEAIARLCATRKLTETEACLVLDINPQQWTVFKSRNRRNEVFNTLITRLKGQKIETLINRIESASDDMEIPTAKGTMLKRGDWRAAAWITERIAPERFALQQSAEQAPAPIINVAVMSDTLKRIYDVQQAITGEINGKPCQDSPKLINNAPRTKVLIPKRRAN